MLCQRCNHDSPAGQKFCGECGTRLSASCPACGSPAAPEQRFCGDCGAPLSEPATTSRFASPDSYTPKHLADRILLSRDALGGERKQITVLFADITGSLELIEGSDPERAHLLLDTTLHTMIDAVHRYEGTVNKVLGDGIMALFGAPIALEDHAVRACYAALAMQSATREAADETRQRYGVEPQIRVGLNSGEVVVRAIGNDLSMDYDAIGPTTHLAGRMEQIAIPGTIRLTQHTLRLAEGFVRVKSLGPVPIKGLDQPIEIFELESAMSTRSRFQAALARGLTRFVGRSTELEAMTRALDRAAAGHGQVFALIGEAGVGKSRLFHEFTHSHRTQGMLILESRSVSYGQASAYFPVIDLLKTYFSIEDRDEVRRVREKVTGKVLTLDEGLRFALPALLALLDAPADDTDWEALEPQQRRRRTLEAVKAMLLRESREQPLIVVFEDLHWFDDQSQAFLDSFVDSLPTVPILLLVNYRPEYQHGWGGRTHYSRVRIDPLGPESTTEMLDALLGADPALAPLKRKLIARTEGNPFFVEESVRTLIESGALEGAPGAYRPTRDVTAIDVPATVQGVLMARIDRLPPQQKELLQAASVVGKDVPFTILEAILDQPEDTIRTGLADLQQNEFLYEARLFPDLEYTFKHAHTHEVTYGGLLADRRRALHWAIVDAIERLYPDRLTEQVERLAHHAQRGEMWPQAVAYLRRAGAKAAARSAYREAVDSFDRALLALAHLPPGRDTLQQGIEIRFELRSSLQALGEHERVFENLHEAERLATELDDREAIGWTSSYLSQYLWRMGEPAQADSLGRRALELAGELGNKRLEIVTNFFLGQGYFNVGDYRSAIGHCRDNVAAFTEETLHRRLGLTGLPSVLSRIWLAWSLAELGEFSEAAAHAADALSVAEDAGQGYSITAACLGVGQTRVVRGDFADAIPVLERGAELCEALDLGVIYPTIAAVLGLAYSLLGRVDEALPLVEADLAPGSPVRIFDTSTARTAIGTAYLIAGRLNDARTVALRIAETGEKNGFRGTLARAWLLLGNIEAHSDNSNAAAAEGYYRRALALADELGMRPLSAHASFGLARLHRRLGERLKAEEFAAAAVTMYREMGMRFWLERAQAEP